MSITIQRVKDPCTLRLSTEWHWRDMCGWNIRISGLLPPDPEHDPEEIRRHMEEKLKGRELQIKHFYFVETGSTLVAEVTIDGIDQRALFRDRMLPHQPLERVLEPDDNRIIRKVEGSVKTRWNNPIREFGETQRPMFSMKAFPTDWWVPSYKEELERACKLSTDAREKATEDYRFIETFLAQRNEPICILFGECGSGKSWFIRKYLFDHPPKDTDVAFIDAIDFPRGEHAGKLLTDRLNQRLSELLNHYVNTREGGLIEALRFALEPEAKGIFPDKRYSDSAVRSWCEQRLVSLSMPDQIETYNLLRLKSYSYSKRNLLLVIDNIDAFYHTEDQGRIFDIVVQALDIPSGVSIIVPMRPSTAFMRDRLSTHLQKVISRYRLSLVDVREMLKKRLLVSESGDSLANFVVDSDSGYTYIDILNQYINSHSERIINDLVVGDLRHTIRLFRRLLFSDQIGSFDTIGKAYDCIQALMMKPGERYEESSSYIINAFDNERPNEIGNALIRWRVLEYFLKGYDRIEGQVFEYYFRRYGYDLERVNETVELWEKAGAVELFERRDFVQAIKTGCALGYERLVRNLWYCICIKTGMNIDESLILSGTEARREAAKVGLNLAEGLEWVSDRGFLQYLATEETLEEHRLSGFHEKIPQLEEACRGRGPSSIYRKLDFEYSYTLRDWLVAKGR